MFLSTVYLYITWFQDYPKPDFKGSNAYIVPGELLDPPPPCREERIFRTPKYPGIIVFDFTLPIQSITPS